MSMIGTPTSTVSPSATCRAATTPANGEGNSTAALAVSTSAIIWLSSTVSPTATSQVQQFGLGQAFAQVGKPENS